MKRVSRTCRQTGTLILGIAYALSIMFTATQAPADTPHSDTLQQQHSALRVISTDAATTTLLLSLGLESALVGIDVTSEQPNSAHPIPRVGYHRNLSAEGLLSLAPTHLIGSSGMGPASAIQVTRDAGVTVIQQPEAHTPNAVRQNLTSLTAELAPWLKQHGTTVASLLNRLDTALNTLATHRPDARHAPRMAFLLAAEPGTLRLAGSETTGDAFITLLGGRNVADFAHYRNVSEEALLEWAPEVLLITGSHAQAMHDRFLDTFPVLAHTPAIQQQQLHLVDGRHLVAGLSLPSIFLAETLQQRILERASHAATP